MVGAQPAIVGAPEFHGGIEPQRHLGRLDEHLPALTPVGGIGCHEHLALPVSRTPLVQPHLVVLNDVLGFYAPQTLGTQRHRRVVKQIRANLRH